MSRHRLHVAISLLPTMGFPGRDAKLQVATSHTATHVATSKLMSRLQISSASSLLCRDALFPCRDLPCCHPCRDLPCCHPCRDLKNDVATSSRPSRLSNLSQPKNPGHNALNTKQGRDLKAKSRPQICSAPA